MPFADRVQHGARLTPFDPRIPIDLGSREFSDHQYDWYRFLLEHAPACRGKLSVLRVNLVARYDDCRTVLTDPRFLRNRGRAAGKGASPLPFPLPKSIAALARSMIIEDDPEHRRLRNLVSKAFTPRAIGRLSHRVEELSHELLDGLEKRGASFDLLEDYARPIPERVIAEMMGLPDGDTDRFHASMHVLSKGLSGWSIARTLLWDLRAARRTVNELIERKRAEPGDDILSQLIHAEEAGDRLTHDETLSLVFLLIIAGFETTLHLITNGVRTLLEHPAELARLHAEPELWDSGVEEIVRHRGPIHATKPVYPSEDVTFHGVTFERGTPTLPLLAAANHDPAVFEEPDRFDVARSPNRHLGFGFGAHFCLGAQLARMETRVALRNLFERAPELRLAVKPEELRIQRLPGWHRHESLPVVLG
ncbi:MAG TPA: cytochrome P450 [Myxococcota bacterium]|nr:cytochrome P450 [Myxococcota bacterium]